MNILTTEQAQQIEEALEYARNVCAGSNWSTDDTDEALAAIRAVRAQEQEPVAWTATRLWNRKDTWKCPADIEKDLLYAAPVRTKDLTDEELEEALVYRTIGWAANARAVIAADREKNK